MSNGDKTDSDTWLALLAKRYPLDWGTPRQKVRYLRRKVRRLRREVRRLKAQLAGLARVKSPAR